MNQTEIQHGIPQLDLQWFTDLCVMITQLLIATVADVLHVEWLIMIVTFGGTLLCLAGGALPQLKEEGWSCRKLNDETQGAGPVKQKTIILTRGNDTKHVMIIH